MKRSEYRHQQAQKAFTSSLRLTLVALEEGRRGCSLKPRRLEASVRPKSAANAAEWTRAGSASSYIACKIISDKKKRVILTHAHLHGVRTDPRTYIYYRKIGVRTTRLARSRSPINKLIKHKGERQTHTKTPPAEGGIQTTPSRKGAGGWHRWIQAVAFPKPTT